MSNYLILGSGLAGLSCSYHIGHENCLLLEKNLHAYGHIHSQIREGFTWDQGPHVSFTKHEYVRNLFANNVDNAFEEKKVQTSNYYQGSWIAHPAQSNLYQIPEPLRTKCLDSFLASRNDVTSHPNNYYEWLKTAFGPVFADTFPAAYTRKYWTVDPRRMTTDWVGGRVFQPNVEDVIQGSRGPLDRQTHYIQSIRYPTKGGYESFAKRLRDGANIHFGNEVIRIDLKSKKLWTSAGQEFEWKNLINTIPLPVFIGLCVGVPKQVIEAARALSCSSVYLVNVTAKHPTKRSDHWMYVYDEDKFSTRINCTEMLSKNNAPTGMTGVQVEVYHSRHKPLLEDPRNIQIKVLKELHEMEIIERDANVTIHGVHCPWANVIFTNETSAALSIIYSWLENYGLERENDDLHPLTNWNEKHDRIVNSNLSMAGRFGQWKYYWTDDCVLRGKEFLQKK